MRSFAAVGLSLGAACAPPQPSAHSPEQDAGVDAAPMERDLVVVTLNTHSFQEGPTSIAKLEQIGRTLASLHADLVGLNEVMAGAFYAYDMGGAVHDAAEIVRAALEGATGAPWYMARAGFAHWDTGEEMSNVILSRTPLVDESARSLTTTDFWPAPSSQRSVLGARTQVDGVGPIRIVLTHPWGWSSVDTLTQIGEVKAFVGETVDGDEALTLVIGDLNTPSTWPAHDAWLTSGAVRLQDTYAVANPGHFAEPTTFDESHRIDYVLAAVGCPRCDPARLTSTLVFDGTTTPRVSDHKGVMTVFRAR